MGAVPLLQRSPSQQSSVHLAPEIALHTFKYRSESSHVTLAMQSLRYDLVLPYSMVVLAQRSEPARQSASFCLLLQSSMLDELLHV